MKKTALVILTFMLLAMVAITACKRKKKEDPTPNDGTTKESNEAQSQWDDILKISEDVLDEEGEMNGTRTAGVLACTRSITKTTISEGDFIGQITIDFGTETNEVCNDGRVRRGILIVKYTGKYRDNGTVIQVTTQNYYVNDVRVQGRRTVTNTGSNVYNVVDAGEDGTGYARLTHSDNTFTTWKSTRTRTWVAGTGTPLNLLDDEYLISGEADGTTRYGVNYTLTASSIRIKLLCYSTSVFMPVSGTITINAEGGSRSINYGDGACDRKVTYTHTDGKVYEITL